MIAILPTIYESPTLIRRVGFTIPASKDPFHDVPTLSLENDTTTIPRVEQEKDDLSWMDSLPCPEAPLSPEVSKKRSSMEDDTSFYQPYRETKTARFEDDEVELFDPSTGPESVAEYDLVDGRFVKVSNDSTRDVLEGDMASIASAKASTLFRTKMRRLYNTAIMDYDGWTIFNDGVMTNLAEQIATDASHRGQ
jgi:hypothetical protein